MFHNTVPAHSSFLAPGSTSTQPDGTSTSIENQGRYSTAIRRKILEGAHLVRELLRITYNLEKGVHRLYVMFIHGHDHSNTSTGGGGEPTQSFTTGQRLFNRYKLDRVLGQAYGRRLAGAR